MLVVITRQQKLIGQKLNFYWAEKIQPKKIFGTQNAFLVIKLLEKTFYQGSL